MYDRIMVPMALDHGISETTLKIARTLANDGASIMAMHVHEAPPSSVTAYVDRSTLQAGYEKAGALLKEKTAGLEGVTAHIVQGHTYRSILDFAKEHQIECIVIGSHRPELSDFLLGSTAARVVRHAPCAVHVHRT